MDLGTAEQRSRCRFFNVWQKWESHGREILNNGKWRAGNHRLHEFKRCYSRDYMQPLSTAMVCVSVLDYVRLSDKECCLLTLRETVMFMDRALWDDNGHGIPRGQGDIMVHLKVEGWGDA